MQPNRGVQVTPEWVARFAAYFQQNPAWGIFHVGLGDGNWKSGAWRDEKRLLWHPELVEMADYFDRLSPSQRRKLGRKAEALKP